MTATEQQHATAVLAVINAAVSPKVAYETDRVPSPRPENYVEVTVVRQFAGVARMAAGRGVRGWRVLVRPVSQVSLKDARVMGEKARTALEDAVLTVSGSPTTPVEFESAEPIGPDDGWFSGITSWTYTH